MTAMVEPSFVSSQSSSRRGGGAASALDAASAAAVRLVLNKHALRIISLNADLVPVDDQLVLQEPAHRTRVDDVLLAQHTRGERFWRIARLYRHLRLDHDRAVIQLRG